MSLGSIVRRVFLLLAVIGCLLTAPTVAQIVSKAPEGRQARLQVRNIAGRLILRCELSTKHRRIPVNLFVDYDRPVSLELHNKAVAGLKMEDNGGTPVTIHVPGFPITIVGREHGDEDFLDEFTRLYSKELGEVACVGSIGGKILEHFLVTFNLNSGFIYLEKARERTQGPPPAAEGALVTSITVTNDLVWIPIRRPDGKIGAVHLQTTSHDSVVDENICDELGHPAGDIGEVRLKTLDLSQYVAWRPVEFVQVHADGAFGAIGLNVLEHFRVEVDRVNRVVSFVEVKEASFPTADLAYFKAMVEEEVKPLLDYLKTYPGSRLSREAAETLMNLQLDSAAPAEEFAVAIEWMDRTRIDDLRSTEALATMKSLVESRRPKVAIMAGQVGVKSGRKDRYPESVSLLHAKLGELLLDDGRGDKAWEHLLSAAFGLPEDGIINLHLGRYYEQEKRYKRAMSRYIQAVTKAESGPMAIDGLERVQQALDGERLSVDTVDKMVQGKVYNFGAATSFKTTKDNDTNRCVLVELFTNAHFGRRVREGWRSFGVGGAMGIEGILSHYPRDRVAVICYHVDQLEPTALQNPLSMAMATGYGDTRPVYMKINGVETGPGAGRWRDAEKIYRQNREIVLDLLEDESDYEIEIEAAIDGDVLTGSVKIEGAEEDGIIVQLVLVERGVLYPGKANVVVHRMVGRGSLLGSMEGIAFAPGDGATMKHAFKKSLEQLRRENEAYLDDYERRGGKPCSRLSTKIDPRQVSLVGYVKNRFTGEVLQARQVDAKVAKKETK